jgi:hypothetical protein
MHPRIYTYKITFKGVPYWYWGVHKEKVFRERYFGSPIRHKWAWEFYVPEVQILEVFPYTDEGWVEACEIEKRLIRPDLNNANCLNGNCAGVFSLEVVREGGKKHAEALHAEKDETGKSLHALRCLEKMHAKKDENGKSVQAAKGGAVTKLKTQKRVELTRIHDGEVFIFDSGRDAARAFGLHVCAFSRVCNGERKSVGGFMARYLA